MKCINQYFRKRALIRKHTVTGNDLLDDIHLNRMMREQNWEADFQSDMRRVMIFNRAWKERFVRRLKAL